ncbi:MAG: hypothetical protein KUG79_19020 [Pseudomonadales bacterium]|nr:hypothetical protein [Pseudomonadales bacterium]
MNIYNFARKYGWQLVTIMCIGLLSACGGGGGGSSSSPAGPQNSAPAQISVSGAVIKGPVNGATVEFFNLDDFGNLIGDPVNTTTTNESGNFDIQLDSGFGDLAVVTSGGRFIDESDQEPDVALKRQIQLSESDNLFSIITEGSTSVAITPMTSVLYNRAVLNSSLGGGFLDQFNAANSALSEIAGFDLVTTIPANPVAPDEAATEAQKQYALLLGGLANAINNISQAAGFSEPNFAVVRSVIDDLIDGRLDGFVFGEPTGELSETVTIPTTIDLDTEILRFRNNNAARYEGISIPNIETTAFANNAPIANAGLDQTVAGAATVVLDGASSSDAEGGISFAWVQTQGQTVSLDDPSIASPSFLAPSVSISEVLTFSVTVTDSIGLEATDTVDINIDGLVPQTFLIIDELGQFFGDDVGEDLDGGGQVSLNADGTGSLLLEEGTIDITYDTEGDELRIVFDEPFIIDDFEDSFDVDLDGVPEQFNVDEVADFFELTLVERTSDGDRFTIREVGTRVFTGVDTELTRADEPYEFNDPIRIFDFNQQIPFVIAEGTSRSLLINAIPQFPALENPDELYLDEFIFSADGTGSTTYNAVDFTYTLNTDGHLSVVFDNDETAEYFHLTTRDSGDVVAVRYSLNGPLVPGDDALIGDVRLSFLKDPNPVPAPTSLLDIAGIFTGLFRYDNLRDPVTDNDLVAEIIGRTNPDGTGSIEGEFRLDSQGTIQIGSDTGRCVSIVDGEAVFNSVSARNLLFPGSSTPTVEFCAALTDEQILSSVTSINFGAADANEIKAVRKIRSPSCGSPGDLSCATPTLMVTDFEFLFGNKIPLTVQPPLAVFDNASLEADEPVIVDVVANDIAGDLAIDLTSVEIARGPFFGTATVDAVTGVITYISDLSGALRDTVQYRVSDTSGNESTIGRLDIQVSPPVAVAVDQTVPFDLVGGTSLVTLDGSQSRDDEGVVSFEWVQNSGSLVELSDAFGIAPTFFAPLATDFSTPEVLNFSLIVRDANGFSDTTTIDITFPPVVPAEFFSVLDNAHPVAFGSDVSTAAQVSLVEDGTGVFVDNLGSFGFTWNENGSILSLNFSDIGGLELSRTNEQLDVDADGLDETVETLLVIDIMQLQLQSNGLTVNGYSVTNFLTRTVTDLTNSVEIESSNPVDEAGQFQGFDSAQTINFAPTEGSSIALQTNISADIPTILDAPELNLDELFFNAGAQGRAVDKNSDFSYVTQADGHLTVTFTDGEVADYYRLEERATGTVVATRYAYTDGTVRAFAELSFVDDLETIFTNFNTAGLYESLGTSFVTAGDIPVTTLFHLRPEGNGVAESQIVDDTTGVITEIFQSTFGICWFVDEDDDLIIQRTLATNQLYVGSRVPSVSHCAGLNDGVNPISNNQTSFERDMNLFDVTSDGTYRSITLNALNDCASVADPTIVIGTGCDENTLNINSFFPRVERRTAYTGNPPIAVPDFATFLEAQTLIVTVVSNDLIGDSTIDNETVEIVLGPFNGIATVNSATGEISYTSDVGTTDDVIYYRVRDANGNLSTIGEVFLALP